jgi:short-subunit dehydrogenase
LVNNAGYSQSGAIEEVPLDAVRRQFETNVFGLARLTQLAVEAISDALRFEVRGFGVDVIVIEPGLIKTSFGETAAGSVDAEVPSGGPYGEFNAAVAKGTAEVYDGPLARLGAGPEAVARTIEKAISARRPKTRYPVTASARLALGQRRLVTDRMWDRLMGGQFPAPGKQG